MLRVAPHDAPPAARHAFWASVVLGCLNLAAAAIQPIAEVAAAIVFFAVAWGIRRGRAWAAIAGICCLAPPLLMLALHGSVDRSFVASAILTCALLLLFGRAAVALWADRRHRAALPWAPGAFAALLFWLAFHPVQVSSGSMEKTLMVGDQVLIEHASWVPGRRPELGDVVVIHHPLNRTQTLIKRVVAGPGDRIRLRDKQLFRNDEPVVEPYAFHGAAEVAPYRDNFPGLPPVELAAPAQEMLRYYARNGELTIPDGRYFVLGDNRDDSLDSRYFGLITASDVIGSPVFIYGPRRPRLVR